VRATMQGGIIDKDMPLPVSAVAILCSKDGPTRVRYEIDADGTKRRVCAKCGETL
jgi:large subunit ribosomal protein L24